MERVLLRVVISGRLAITLCRASFCFAASWAGRPTPGWRAADQIEQPGVLGDRGAALGQLQAGRAAIDSGAVEPGIVCLRMACAEGRACGDADVLAQVLLELGSALVHAVPGRDEEGAAMLHEALAVAESLGTRAVAVEACRELGYIEVQAGPGGDGRPVAGSRERGRRWEPRARKGTGRSGDGAVGPWALRGGD